MVRREALRPRVVDSVLFNGKVYFVSSKGHHEAILVCRRVLLHLADPVLHGLEALLVRQVVADDGADCVSIVHIDHGAEPLVATCVPDVHLYLLIGPCRVLRILYADDFL